MRLPRRCAPRNDMRFDGFRTDFDATCNEKYCHCEARRAVAIRFSAFEECHCPEGNFTNKHEFGREQKLQNVTFWIKKLTQKGADFGNFAF